MLENQINLYSVDTGHFYTNSEKYLHTMNCKYRRERNYIKNKLPELEKKLKEFKYSDDEIKTFSIGGIVPDVKPEHHDVVKEYFDWNVLVRHKAKKARESKNKLLSKLDKRLSGMEKRNKKQKPIISRVLRENDLHDNNIISVFESSLTRLIGLEKDELTDALVVVQVYYFDIFKDISYFGFTYKGEKYKYFTSSAGQIRKKKAVFIKESVWNKIEKSVMCGLTIEAINNKGGNNVNKHLAYMALANSATDEWKDFDIDRCIVIDDFETDVSGTFDFIDDSDYSITRTNGIVPITHTDGAGMMLPSVMTKNTMVRLPWIKGLLGVFDFRKFIEENNFPSTIKDIYGKEHDVIKEDIRIIFTKSQFKMAKYYSSWKSYKKKFKKYKCQAGLCNTEEDRIKPARINYQMLQTLTDITDEEIKKLVSKSVEKISGICNSEDSMKAALGITPYNENMTSFQKAVKIYPALLNDTYAKDVLREIKKSLLKKYRSGKLEINGRYTFLLPDFYAACEYWFGGIKNPRGLLGDGEVFCWLYNRFEKLDCLRSPHLYKEHAVRKNVAKTGHITLVEEIRKWFPTDAIYTSTYDLISKVLQFDVDGDRGLVVADPEFVSLAERNMRGIVPLYYNMRKAEPSKLTPENIYKGLNAAFTGGNIGIYSNNISKIWNDQVFINGTDDEKSQAIDCVKRLCCQNNFVIDYAKTLYKPEFPLKVNKDIKKFTDKKLPAFFEYAKDKEKHQVEKRNKSLVNKIYDLIPDKSLNTRGLNLGDLDYRLMMDNVNVVCSREVSDLYEEVSKQYSFMVNMKDEYVDNLRYLACNIRSRFNELGYSDQMVSDMLVQRIYGKNSRRKQLLWFCYGRNIVENLEKHVSIKKTKRIQCIDCGEWIEVDVKDTNRERCGDCYRIYRRKYKAEMERERRNKLKRGQSNATR